MYKISTLFLVLFIAVSQNFNATIVTSNGTGGGDWGAPDTWIPAGVPGCVDTIAILAGDVIEITSNQNYDGCSKIIIMLDGTIHFPDNGPKLYLPCGSSIIGSAGAAITAPGGDNSNKISICGNWVFESKDPDLSGPFIVQEVDYVVIDEVINVSPLLGTLRIGSETLKIRWSTSSEFNNDYFTVERSKNGIDFEVIEEIAGGGNVRGKREYELYDDSPLTGTSYYRLKQTSINGEFKYIGLTAVNYNLENDGTCTLHVYPNPCVGSCTIDLKDCPLADSQVNIELYDAFGKKIINRITPKNRDQDISFHLNSSNNLAPGVYIVRSRTNGKDQSSKVIIK
ncbi:MAG: hypothetical protein COA97_04565 [Flavobacteriales bacterium]|nr:MAG: hypothetical protein COA97_04565 [Flavobacteriales bacterium]